MNIFNELMTLHHSIPVLSHEIILDRFSSLFLLRGSHCLQHAINSMSKADNQLKVLHIEKKILKLIMFTIVQVS